MNSLGGVVRFGEGGVGQRPLACPALIPSFSPLCLAPFSPHSHLSLKMTLTPLSLAPPLGI